REPWGQPRGGRASRCSARAVLAMAGAARGRRASRFPPRGTDRPRIARRWPEEAVCARKCVFVPAWLDRRSRTATVPRPARALHRARERAAFGIGAAIFGIPGGLEVERVSVEAAPCCESGTGVASHLRRKPWVDTGRIQHFK